MNRHEVDAQLAVEVSRLGARDMEICMQCATCSASCPLSEGANAFPRKIYRYLQLGLRDKLLESPEPWLCYYCGECNIDCPRGAEPAETMMAARRWLTTQYDWTGLARRFYLSAAWELGALGALALGVVLLFVFFHGPVVTDRVSVNTFAPVMWIEIGDLLMAAVLTAFLLSNAFRMYRHIMAGTRAPLSLYLVEARTFLLHFATQKRWRKCGEDRSRWLKHFILVTGYMTMMTLVIVCIRWFQVDDSSWHFTSLFGYYATGALLVITVEMFRSRLRKEEAIHRYSELSDWLFLILLFATTVTGIAMHGVRLAGWPMGTYVIYVIHLAVAVPMLVIEVPFGKWSHLFYRPLAVFLASVKEKAASGSRVTLKEIAGRAGEAFMACMQCGTCNAVCPVNQATSYSPRHMLLQVAMGTASEPSLDLAAWTCATCNACTESCPRGIAVVDVIRAVRGVNHDAGRIPASLEAPLASLQSSGNPWNRRREERMQWAEGLEIPPASTGHEYGLFTCCTTAFDPAAGRAGRALPQLLTTAGIAFGALGNAQSCCGDPAHNLGAVDTAVQLARSNADLLRKAGVEKVLTVSPHCLNAFQKHYSGLNGSPAAEHYTELLDRLMAENRLKPAGAFPARVTYHDPCYLGRYSGIYEAPRRILRRIPGLELVEMAGSRGHSLCCGGGGGGAWQNNCGNSSLGEARVREALDTGADVLVTACPYCIRMLTAAAGRLGVEDRIAIQDLAEPLLASVGAADAACLAEHLDTGIVGEAHHA